MENTKGKVLEINGIKYWKRREFPSGSTYEAEMFWIPYFKLDKGKVIQASDNIPTRFYKTLKLIQEFELYLDFKNACYFTWRELTKDNFTQFNKYGLSISDDDRNYKKDNNGNNKKKIYSQS